MYTFKYKIGYIHENFSTNEVMVQIRDMKRNDGTYYTKYVKSVHSAKMFITQWDNALKRRN